MRGTGSPGETSRVKKGEPLDQIPGGVGEVAAMTHWIVAWSMKFRLLVVALAALTLVVGVSELRSMPVDVLPEYAPVTVEVQTEALGLSSAEVEQLITVPIEQDLLNGIAFLKDIRSQSVPGLSRIFLIFDQGTDLFTARQVVAERMTQAHALPNVSKPPQILQPLSSTNRVLMVGVNSKTLSPIQMSVLARWTIIPRLLGVPGVANVVHLGRARTTAAGAGRSGEAGRSTRVAAAGDRHER